MFTAIRTITSSDAKANLGGVLSSLRSSGPIEITTNGKPVGLLSLPHTQSVDQERLSSLAIAYSKGLVSWPQIAEETDIGFGDLLVALGKQNLSLPKVRPKNNPEQIRLLNHVLDLAVQEKKVPLQEPTEPQREPTEPLQEPKAPKEPLRAPSK